MVIAAWLTRSRWCRNQVLQIKDTRSFGRVKKYRAHKCKGHIFLSQSLQATNHIHSMNQYRIETFRDYESINIEKSGSMDAPKFNL